jgi:hypothetical protein
VDDSPSGRWSLHARLRGRPGGRGCYDGCIAVMVVCRALGILLSSHSVANRSIYRLDRDCMYRHGGGALLRETEPAFILQEDTGALTR